MLWGSLFRHEGSGFFAQAKNTPEWFLRNAKNTPEWFLTGSHPGALHRPGRNNCYECLEEISDLND